jgi:GT2 family glycosyltransferase
MFRGATFSNNKMREEQLAIGVLSYGKSTLKYLPYFFDSLDAQTRKDFSFLVFDNTEIENNENSEYIKKRYPSIEIARTGENIGFARAYNILFDKAIEAQAEYFLALNLDMILEPDAIERLVASMESDLRIGSASPKVFRWDFESQEKTKLIDTFGIVMKPGMRFFNLGQNQNDLGQFDSQEILGPSGCAAIYRLSALKKVKDEYGYFDERMFMYKEDCDLAFRMKLAGFKSKLVRGSVVYHDRTAKGRGDSDILTALNRKNKSRIVKAWSLANQLLIFKKHWKRQDFLNKLSIVIYSIKMIAYSAIFEQYLLKIFVSFFNEKRGIKI